MRALSARRLVHTSRLIPEFTSSLCSSHGLWQRSLAPAIAVELHTSVSLKPFHSSASCDLHSSTLRNAPPDLVTIQSHSPTIYALSTASGRAAIAVVRISGPACLEIYQRLCPGKPPPKPRFATLRSLHDPSTPSSRDAVLDPGALVFYFPSPKTVTGEDVLELHVHGGPAIVKSVLMAIPKCGASIRYAEPGEFTRRAFMNDRLDLTQVEALGDILTATTEQQRRLAVRGTSNDVGKRYESWRQMLLYARGELEALIDFSEDQHFDESPSELAQSVATQVESLSANIEAHVANAVRGELLRNGISLALLGAPNAGKSSLLNCIVGREAAIVSSEAGTTRDVVEVGLDLGGYYCKFGDMAGLRRSAAKSANSDGITASSIVGAIEQEGIKRAKQRALEADVVIVVCSIESASGSPHSTHRFLIDEEVQETAKLCVERGAQVVVVVNKIDNLPSDSREEEKAGIKEMLQDNLGISGSLVYFVSCKEATQPRDQTMDPGNVQAFLHGMIKVLQDMTNPISHPDSSRANDTSNGLESLGATERHRVLLNECLRHLQTFLALVTPTTEAVDEIVEELEFDIVAAAESLRAAADCLARITGKGEAGDVEEVLGVVFEK